MQLRKSILTIAFALASLVPAGCGREEGPPQGVKLGPDIGGPIRDLAQRRSWHVDAVKIWLANPVVVLTRDNGMLLEAWPATENDYNVPMIRLDAGERLYELSLEEYLRLQGLGEARYRVDEDGHRIGEAPDGPQMSAQDRADLEERLRYHGFDEPADVERLVIELRRAARAGDRSALVNAIRYPFTTYQSGEAVRTYRMPADVLRHYDTIFSARVLDALRIARYDSLFVRDIGAMIGRGEVWLQQRDGRVRIKAVNSWSAVRRRREALNAH